MENRLFIFALIISLIFHYWAIIFFSDIATNWQHLENEIIFLASIAFLKPPSPGQPAEEKLDKPYLNEESDPAEINRSEEIGLPEEIFEKEELDEKEISITEQYLSKTEEIVLDEILSHNNTISETYESESNYTIEQTNKIDDLISVKTEDPVMMEQTQENIYEKMFVAEEKVEHKPCRNDSPLDLTSIDLNNESIIAPKVISFQPPEYPDNFRQRGIEGRVQIKALIDKKGDIIEIVVDTSSGYPGFDRNAIEAISKWKFQPAYYNNEERACWVLIPIIFQLK
ncbi:MAG: energy transducer TonB [Atribacterota bacterium]